MEVVVLSVRANAAAGDNGATASPSSRMPSMASSDLPRSAVMRGLRNVEGEIGASCVAILLIVLSAVLLSCGRAEERQRWFLVERAFPSRQGNSKARNESTQFAEKYHVSRVGDVRN